MSEKTIFCNSSATFMLGFDVEELMGNRLHPLFHHSRPDGSPYPMEQCPIYHSIKTGIRQRKSDRLSVVGQLAAGVAHEIRNPLTSLKGFIQLLQRNSFKENHKHLEIMLSEIDRMNLIVSELLILSLPQAVHFKKKNIVEIIESVVTLMDTQAIMHNVQISSEFEAPLPMINCEENQIKQVMINILKNAIEAMPNGGNVHIKVMRQDNNIWIRLIDQGTGIPEQRIPRH